MSTSWYRFLSSRPGQTLLLLTSRYVSTSPTINTAPPINPLPPTSISSNSQSAFQILRQLPPLLVAKLKPDLKVGQLLNVLKMHRARARLPPHLFNFDPLTVWPRRGVHPNLSVALRKRAGRNHHGKITCRHRGGGFKRRIRLVDRQRVGQGIFRVVRIEHDPNRSAKLALVQAQETRQVSYVLAWDGCKKGDLIINVVKGRENGEGKEGGYLNKSIAKNDGNLINPENQISNNEIKSSIEQPNFYNYRPGNNQPLRYLALGTTIHNIELHPDGGGQICRSAGCKATLIAKDEPRQLATIKLPSGKLKRLPWECRATIGRVGNAEWHLRIIGKAGRNRNLGWRPTVRGVAMNAVDHPHGGGKGGRSKGHHSQSPWGKICK